MSIITLSALLDQISGRIGEVIFCRDGVGGPYVRGFGPVFNPMTEYQTSVRSLLTTCSRTWAELSMANRAAWNAFAKAHKWPNRLSKDITLTGFDWFTKLLFQATYYKQPVDPAPSLDNPPTSLTVTPLTKVDIVSASAATKLITIMPTPGYQSIPNTRLLYFFSQLLPVGITKAKQVNFSYSTINDEDSPVEYDHQAGRYQPPTVGARCIIGVARMNLTSGVLTERIDKVVTWAA